LEILNKGTPLSYFTKSIGAILLISIFQGCANSEEKSDSKNQETTTVVTQESNNQITKNLVSKKIYTLQGVESGKIEVEKEGNSFRVIGGETRLVLFDFFTTWCPACRAVAPHLSNIQAKYPKEIAVIGVLIEEGKSNKDIINFKHKYKADYIISNATTDKYNFGNFKLSNDIAALLRQPRSFPIPLLVMLKDGEYFTHYVGAVPEEMIESDIKEALNLRGE
jgi:thiol-disulfide isomerase/thioredoxin